MDGELAQQLSPRCEGAISRILGAEAGAFDGPTFSVVSYINGAFPDEGSFAGLDATIADLDAEIAALDGSIRETVREQSCAGATAGRDVAEAKDSIGDLAAKIAEIKRKADASEAMVQEICRDIRQLDVAKKNLTGTINVLARLKTLAGAVDDLRANSSRRDYEKAAPVFEAAISMFAHFTEYRDVPKVSELATAVEKIRDELREAVTEDFDILLDVVTPSSAEALEGGSAAGGGGGEIKLLKLNEKGDLDEGGAAAAAVDGGRELSEDNVSTLRAACDVVDALGPKERRTLLKSFTRKQMKPYALIFRRGSAEGWGDSLEGMDKRYGWFRRALKAVDGRYGAVMPPAWRVLHRMCVEFCEATRSDLERILGQYDPPTSAPAVSLLIALSATQRFEKEMAKKFDGGGGAGGGGGEAGAGAAAPPSPGEEDEALDESAPLYNAKGAIVDPATAEGVRLKYARRKEHEKRLAEARSRGAARDERRKWLASLAGTDAAAGGGGGGGGGGDAAAAALRGRDEDTASLPRITEPGRQGLVSAAFEPYMGSYVKFERSKIEEKVAAALAEDFAPRAALTAGSGGGGGAPPPFLSSSSVLFAEARNAVSRCHQLGMPTVMVALFREIRDAFTHYAAQLGARVAQPLPPAPGALPGDNYDVPADPVAGGPPAVERLALIISTADYCAETLPALADNIRKVVDAGAREAVDLSAVADGFLTLQAGALRALAGFAACLLDRCLRALIATPWERLAEVGDSSPYVADVGRVLRATMPLLRARLADAAFRNVCDKFAKAFIGRYQAAIFKCPRIGELGAQQLLLDAQGMRAILLAAPTMRAAGGGGGAGGGAGGGGGGGDDDDEIRTSPSGLSAAGREGGAAALGEDGAPLVAPAIYTKTVTREMPRIEMLFKIIAAPKDRFADTIKALWPEVSAAELGRVMELKNLSKKDQGDVFAQLGFAKPAAPSGLGGLGGMTNVVAGLGGGGGGGGGSGAGAASSAGGGGSGAAAASSVASSIKESSMKAMGKLFGAATRGGGGGAGGGGGGGGGAAGNPFK